MDDDQQFCLRWNNHQSTLISVFDTLLENETLVDCTLAAEGKFLKAHKVVLSACSPYFATLLQEQYDKHPIFILKDVKFQELRAMMDYMYRGEVNISQDQLAALLKAAESLQIKGLSDNRQNAPKPEHHRAGLNVPVSSAAANLGKVSSGYTLEQTKRARIGGSSALEAQDITASREGSSSPSRRRRKVRRRSIENAMGDIHDNSNSSQIQQQQQSSLQQQQQSNVNLAGIGAIAAAAPSALGTQIAAGTSTIATSGTIAGVSTQGLTQQLTTNVTKKTESVKGTSDAMNTDNVQAEGTAIISGGGGAADEQNVEHKTDKTNHKQKLSAAGTSSASAVGGKDSTELIIEPKNEYDEECNDETVEDLTLDDDMGMEDLDQNAGTSQGGEGSSQGYGAWQHDRSQDDILLATQDAQQRDPQVKHDKSEQTDITPEEFDLDDCLLESNDIVITQNKDGFVLHVKKLGNITTAKIATNDEDQAAAAAVAVATGQPQISTVQSIGEMKSTLTTLQPSHSIKLPSSECELIELKKIIPTTTTIATHHPHAGATIVESQHIQHSPQSHIQQHQPPQQQQQPQQSQVQSIVTASHPQTINLMGLRNVQISEQKPLLSRIKYSRGKIITPQGSAASSVQIVDPLEVAPTNKYEITEMGTKYEISEIELNNTTTSTAIISDLVKYAEIDNIELPDGTKIGIGFANTEISEHLQSSTSGAQITTISPEHHQLQTETHQMQQETHELQLQDQDDTSTTVEATILPDGITLHEHHEHPKSYTILTSRPMKREEPGGMDGSTTTTYELSLSDSSMGHPDDGEAKYVCRHCGKKYRWKSTLRRHENVECGGKEPCHPCPHCSYKAKQRGNLGVHVRKHHPDKPQLASKRGRRI